MNIFMTKAIFHVLKPTHMASTADWLTIYFMFHNNPKYWDRQAFANRVDPDQMLHNVASDQDLHCLSYIQ